MSRGTLLALAERVESAEGADRALDVRVKWTLNGATFTEAEIAEAATVGFGAGEPAMEIAGMIVSHLAIHPEHVERFMKEGTSMMIDGTIRPITGCLDYRAINGERVSPTQLRQNKGVQQ